MINNRGLDAAIPKFYDRIVNVFQISERLEWGNLDIPLLGISRDWQANEVSPPAAWSLVTDPDRLWFVASHRNPALVHPDSRPGRFLSGLWEFDVAELFLAHPDRGRYIEFNLSPNGSWWCGEFVAPRQRAEENDTPMPDVATHAELAPDGSWLAAIAMPLDLLRARIGFGPSTTGNVTFILGSPEQRFLTATDLGPGPPDFHRPDRFERLRFQDGRLPPLGARP